MSNIKKDYEIITDWKYDSIDGRITYCNGLAGFYLRDMVDYDDRTYKGFAVAFFGKDGRTIYLGKSQYVSYDTWQAVKGRVNREKQEKEESKVAWIGYVGMAICVIGLIVLLFSCAMSDSGGSDDWRDKANDANYYQGTDGKWYYEGDGVN